MVHELFADDLRLATSSGFERVVIPATRLDHPVVEPENGRPWEANGTYLYGTVLPDEDGGGYRMWYNQNGMLYATSEDGIHWHKPALGRYVIDGQDTNYVFRRSPFTLNSVLYEPDDPDPSRAYKCLFSTGQRNFGVAFSPDGFSWSEPDGNPRLAFGSEVGNVVRDPLTGEYLGYLRRQLPRLEVDGLEGRRRVGLSTSTDFLAWSPLQAMINPDQIDDAWATEDWHRGEFYGMAGAPYGSQYIGLLPVFRVTDIYRPPAPGQSPYEGPIHCEFISSRDGRTWQRCSDRSPVIPNGPAGSYDAGAIMNVANTPVLVGDEIWWYYTAINTTHGGTRPPKNITIGRAAWRRDRMVGLRCGAGNATLETTDIVLGENSGPARLFVNADVTGGALRVELCQPNGRPLPGYVGARLRGDSLRHEVVWPNGERRLPDDVPFRIRFRGARATLFSYVVEA
ncbi:hypothetical protein [Jiangella rhizosphaerae]|uniref:Glycosyl hydrolase family 32 n=1 Tax=Jiangella rhizosphaerae TaxID=2293569 RepID=A0A418KFY5_9ACTN|nr:hypothetical protein [Jiangella rhizosphaerae]RIQ10842.1 hypothetical protein DY240_31145 [Jiangella rhizosphaerae]